jgi:hypothetical protein
MTCSTCKRIDPECGFSPSERRCRDCCNERQKAYYRKVRDTPEFQAKNRERARAWAEANPQAVLARSTEKRLSHLGLTPGEYESMKSEQDGLCAICGCSEVIEHRRGEVRGAARELAVDHNHACCPPGRACDQCRRGLLCFACNTSLGRLEDHWERATAYLARYRVVH